MTAFVATGALLVALALAWILPPLLRRQKPAVASASSNAGVLRDQLAELQRDREHGLISDEQFQQAQHELERRVLEEVRPITAPASDGPIRPSRGTALFIALALPVSAALIYLQSGNPGALSPQAAALGEVTPQQVERMIEQLSARLAQTPEDADGWALLGRSQFVLQRYGEAARAYERAAALKPDDADLLADYADALASSNDRTIDDRVLALVERALKADPDQWKALAMAGTAAFDRKRYAQAIEYWQKLLKRAPPDSEFARTLQASIAEARALAGGKAAAVSRPAATAEGRVEGTVRLSGSLAAKAAPEDTLFVFARAAQGSRQPLALIRAQVRDLPLEFTLSDKDAMVAARKLSSEQQVVITARVSKSSQAMPQRGDLTGSSPAVKVGATGVSVVIDAIVP